MTEWQQALTFTVGMFATYFLYQIANTLHQILLELRKRK